MNHPIMLYRKGDETAPELHGLHCETLIAESPEDEASAIDEGWRHTPAEAHGKKPERPQADTAADDERAGLVDEVEALRKEIASLDTALKASREDAEDLRANLTAAEKERDETRELIKAFDADNDGKPGGSKPKLGIKTEAKA